MRRAAVSAIVAGLLALSIGSLNARQAPDAPPPTFRVGVDVVRLDVSVLDKNRKPVTGLTAADFTVLEDGKPRPIRSFTAVDLPETAPLQPNTASWTREVAPDVTTNAEPEDGRLVVIMFDWSIRPMDLPLARRIARAAVDDFGPNDQAAIVFSSPLANAAGKQDFTADRARLIAAINRPITTALLTTTDVREIPGNDAMLDDPEGYESTDCGCRLCVMDTVTGVANTLRDVQGRRKLLIFIGTFFQGFEPSTPTANHTPVGRSPFASYYNGVPGSTTPTATGVYEGQCAAQLNTAKEKMLRAAGLANLTIDTFDPSGLTSPYSDAMGGMEQYTVKRRDDLHIMPDATGGRTVLDINDPDTQLPAALDESHAYYVVGFERASAVNDGKLHSIKVKVDRSSVAVRTRTGYFATDALAAADSPGSAPVAQALDSALPEGGLPLAATVAAFAAPTRAAPANVAVIIGVHEPPSRVPASTSANASTSSPHHVIVGLFDTNGRALGEAEQTVTMTTRGASGTDTPFEVLSIIPAKPGYYEIRAAVDGIDGRGSVYAYVDVPDFAKAPLSMSGLLLHAVPPTPVSVPTAVAAVLPVVPMARRTFAATDQVTASLRIYEGGNDAPMPASVTARIVDAHDRRVFEQSVPIDASHFTKTRSANVSVALPLSRLDPGEYLLTIAATAGSHTAHDDVRFTRIER